MCPPRKGRKMSRKFSTLSSAVSSAFLASLLSLVVLSTPPPVSAQEEASLPTKSPTIFDVRKSLPLEPTEKAYHDFYINAGSEAGFQVGQYVPIRRELRVHDPIHNKQQAILTVPVGTVRVIHVDPNLTVARLVEELSNENRPTLEYEAIMIGDQVDVKGISKTAQKK